MPSCSSCLGSLWCSCTCCSAVCWVCPSPTALNQVCQTPTRQHSLCLTLPPYPVQCEIIGRVILFVSGTYVVPFADVFRSVYFYFRTCFFVPCVKFVIHGLVHRDYVVTQCWVVSVYGVAPVYRALAFQVLYWKNWSALTVAYYECGVHYYYSSECIVCDMKGV